MAQHDYVIGNQTAPSFREDLNNALEAIASTNSGPTAPALEETFPGMLWYYTGNTDLVVGTQTIPRNSLNIRSEANDLWYPIGRVSTTNDQFSLFQGANVVTNGGATIVGVIDVQDQATWETGTSTTESLVSPAKIAAAVGQNASGVGVGQTWQAVARVIDTAYQNTTGKPISVLITTSSNMSVEISTDGSTWLKVSGASTVSNNYPVSHNVIVPDNLYYRTVRHSGTQGTAIYTWAELR
jgi:hypothetical protein